MTMITVMQVAAMAFMTLLPVALSVILYMAERRPWTKKLSYAARQTIIGVLFGLIAVLATEAGISVNGAVLNVRNAAFAVTCVFTDALQNHIAYANADQFQSAIAIQIFMEVVVFAALFTHIYFLIKRLIVDNIHKINGSLSQITDGDLSIHVNVRENQKFASLSDDINATVDALKHYIEEAEQRIDWELEFAQPDPTAFPV